MRGGINTQPNANVTGPSVTTTPGLEASPSPSPVIFHLDNDRSSLQNHF